MFIVGLNPLNELTPGTHIALSVHGPRSESTGKRVACSKCGGNGFVRVTDPPRAKELWGG